MRRFTISLEAGDIVIDGGNSYYIDDIRRAKELATKGMHYVDVGTSGGVWGLERGYCQMIGGETQVVQHLDPIFRSLAPGRGDIPLAMLIARDIGGTKTELAIFSIEAGAHCHSNRQGCTPRTIPVCKPWLRSSTPSIFQ